MITVKTDAERLNIYLWWITAVVLLTLGVMVAREGWWATIPLVLIGVLVWPPVFNQLQEKVKLKDRINLRMPIVLLTLCGATYLLFSQDAIIKAQEQEALAKAEQDRLNHEANERADREAQRTLLVQTDFKRDGEKILAQLDKAITDKDLTTAKAIKERFYPVVMDPRLKDLVAKYEVMKQQVERDVAIADLQVKAKTLGVNDYKEAVDIYTKLAALDPANAQYKAKIARYEKIWNEKVARELAATAAAAEKAERTKKIEGQFSGWDGSHRNFESLIKDAMNDPDSYEHVETRYKDMGKYIRVYCTFRGKNAFGGLVKNTKVADYDLEGNFLREVQ